MLRSPRSLPEAEASPFWRLHSQRTHGARILLKMRDSRSVEGLPSLPKMPVERAGATGRRRLRADARRVSAYRAGLQPSQLAGDAQGITLAAHPRAHILIEGLSTLTMGHSPRPKPSAAPEDRVHRIPIKSRVLSDSCAEPKKQRPLGASHDGRAQTRAVRA
jgi:hypothetical protein